MHGLQPMFVFFHLSCKFEILKQLFMKKIPTLLLLLAAFFFSGAQESAPPADALKIKETEHDFGKIPQGKPVYYSFEVTNTGKEALKIDNVQASCGCTTPEWSREPIAPGTSTVIKVGYNAAAEGYFDKSINVIYNNNQSKQLKIKGTVWKAPEGAAPPNAAVQFLKQQTL